MKRLILVGSPRTNGRSAHLGEELFETLIEECPEDELFLVPVSEVEIAPCIGCNACKEKSTVIEKGDNGSEISVLKNRCIFDDDMQALYDVIDEADEVIVVCPVFFSGAPAQFKCVLDRLQPYYWANTRFNEKRPATLHVIGEGGDPHGYNALVSEVRSALSVAGFRLERVLDWVGKIDLKGTIIAEADEHLVDQNGLKPSKDEYANSSKSTNAGKKQNIGQDANKTNQKSTQVGSAKDTQKATKKSAAAAQRPKLKLQQSKKNSKKGSRRE